MVLNQKNKDNYDQSTIKTNLNVKMDTALIIIGLAMFIFIVVFTLKRSKEKRKTQQEEYEKIKEYGEKINEETRNKDK